MPETSKKNKVKFGLKSVYAALLIEDEDGRIS